MVSLHKQKKLQTDWNESIKEHNNKNAGSKIKNPPTGSFAISGFSGGASGRFVGGLFLANC